MNQSLSLLITLAIGLTCGFILLRLKVPAGMIIGSMFGVGLFGIFTGLAYFPIKYKVVVQMLSGVLIGSSTTKKSVIELKTVMKPFSFTTLIMLAQNVIFGLLIYRFSNLDMVTAFFSAAPSGLSDLPLISADFGAVPSLVAFLQLFRFCLAVTITPFTARYFARKGMLADPFGPRQGAQPLSRSPVEEAPTGNIRQKTATVLITTGWGIAGAALGVGLKIPGGAVIGAMVFSAGYNIISGKAFFPKRLRAYIQGFIGTFLGLQITRETIMTLPDLLIPCAILLVGLLLVTVLTTYYMYKTTDLDIGTCLLANTPGGLMEMCLLAQDLNCDVPKIAVFQAFRMLMAVMLSPFLIAFMVSIVS